MRNDFGRAHARDVHHLGESGSVIDQVEPTSARGPKKTCANTARSVANVDSRGKVELKSCFGVAVAIEPEASSASSAAILSSDSVASTSKSDRPAEIDRRGVIDMLDGRHQLCAHRSAKETRAARPASR